MRTLFLSLALFANFAFADLPRLTEFPGPQTLYATLLLQPPQTPASGTFTCASPAATNVLWLDGTDPAGNGTPPSDGSSVSTWVDKSASAHNMTAGVAVVYKSTAGPNSKGSIKFGAGNTYLQNTTAYFTTGAAFDWFFVIQTTVNAQMFFYNDKQAGQVISSSSSNLSFVAPSGDASGGIYTTTINTGTVYVVEFSYDGTGINNSAHYAMHNNGTSLTRSGNSQGNGTTSNSVVGSDVVDAGFAYGGYMAAVCFYSSLLSSGDRTSLNTYLNGI